VAESEILRLSIRISLPHGIGFFVISNYIKTPFKKILSGFYTDEVSSFFPENAKLTRPRQSGVRRMP
jgi:hypothetical protein